MKKHLLAMIGVALINADYEDQLPETTADIVDMLLPEAEFDDEDAVTIQSLVETLVYKFYGRGKVETTADIDEEAELQKLCDSKAAAQTEMNVRFDAGDIDAADDYSITVIVGDRAHRFVLGAPQCNGIDEFVKTIAAENNRAVKIW